MPKNTTASKTQEKLVHSKTLLDDAIKAIKDSAEDFRDQLKEKDDYFLKPLEKVGNILSVGMIVCDQTGSIIMANNEANLIFEYETLLGQHIDSIIEHQTIDNQNCNLNFPKWLKEKDLNFFQPNKQKKLLFGIKKDSSKIYIHVSTSDYSIKDGCKHYILLIKDSSKSTDSNLQNIDLLEKFQSLSTALNFTDNFGICVLEKINDHQKIIYCNSGFTKITGYTEGDVFSSSTFLLEGPEIEKDELERIKYKVDHEKTYEGFIKCYDKKGGNFIGNIKITNIKFKETNKIVTSIYVGNVT